MRLLRHWVLAASATVLAACATTTPYQPASHPGGFDGYSQTMIENNRAKISFGGNSLTDRGTVENYLLYRAAEMASERGFDNFTLVERDTEKNTRVSMTSMYDPYFHYSFHHPRYGWSDYRRYSLFYSPLRRRGFGRFAHFGFDYDPFYRHQYDVREITRYRANAEIIFGHGPKSDGLNTFSAREVLQNLSPSIIYPKDKGS